MAIDQIDEGVESLDLGDALAPFGQETPFLEQFAGRFEFALSVENGGHTGGKPRAEIACFPGHF